MTKEEAREILREKQSELRQAEIVIRRHENGIRKIKEDISELDTIINKKDDWRDREINEDEYVLLMDKVRLMQEMHQFAHVKNEGWLPEWDDKNEEKFGIQYSAYKGHVIDYGMVWNFFVFGVVVKSQEIAEEMLEEFGERIDEIYNRQY